MLKYEVFVPMSLLTSAQKSYDMCQWAKDHKIYCELFPEQKQNAFGRYQFVGYCFRFIHEEDAVAFKLRWL